MITGALVLPEVMVGMTDGVDHAQAQDAVDPQAVVDHGHRVAAHLAGADRVEDRGADVARGLRQLGIALELGARPVFLGRKARHGPAPRRSAG